MSKLSAVQVRNAKSTGKDYKLSDGKGLYFHVSKGGKKTWRYRYRIAGTESTFVLGSYPQMELSAARTARQEARELVKQGINPARERKRKTEERINEQLHEQNTFQVIANEWLDKQVENWSANHAAAVVKSLNRNVFPQIGSRPIKEITTPELEQMMKQVEKRGALEMARKVLQRVNSIFVYADRTGKVTHNPAASLKGSLKTRKVVHHAALSKSELPQFFIDLEKGRLHISTKLALKFLILTAARTDEVRRSDWSEIDGEDMIWRIPASRMKMDAPHNVPLSKQAANILDQIGDTFGKKGYIFPSVRSYEKPMSQNALLYAMHSLGYHSKATVHGFRATFSTIANESGFNPDVIEKSLAHTERNRVRAAYHRSEYLQQRKELMQWWADLLDEMSNGSFREAK